MKNAWIWIALIIVIAGLGYLGRHKLKAMLGMSPTPTPTQEMMAPSIAPSAMPNGLVMTKTDPAKGNYLSDPKGMTIYIFDKDTTGVSNCNNGCAVTWPPYIAATATATMPASITAIKRSDGSMQYAYKGMPLYYYSLDKQVGDLNGDGVGGVWHLVKP